MRKIFIHAAGQLRAGWRLLFWLLIAIGIQVLIGIVVQRLHLANEAAFLDPKRLILGDWVATFIPVIIATLVMMRIERRTLADYYIPVRGLLEKSFWVGVLWGIAAVSLLMGLIARVTEFEALWTTCGFLRSCDWRRRLARSNSQPRSMSSC